MASQVLRWSGPKGGHIGVSFDDEHFSLAQMRGEIAFVGEAHPTLPDEVPLKTSFVFAKESTGHIFARFRVGNTVYRNVAQSSSLRLLWEGVDLIEQLLHSERYKAVS